MIGMHLTNLIYIYISLEAHLGISVNNFYRCRISKFSILVALYL